jgi:hypothetical protein
MDRAKATMVLEAGLQVAECCGTCANWCPGRGGVWGICEKFSYRHQKHERMHNMPAPRFGRCASGWAAGGDDEAISKFLTLARIVASEEPVVDSSCEPQAAVG